MNRRELAADHAAERYARERAARDVVKLLRHARDRAKRAGSPRTLAKIQTALSSAKGAVRHAAHYEYRQERKEAHAE